MADILFRNPYKTETILDEQEIKFTDQRKLGKCQTLSSRKKGSFLLCNDITPFETLFDHPKRSYRERW
jgi:hypothetical protein